MYFERFQFLVGFRDAGKTTQIRSAFRDKRLHTDGRVPKGKNFQHIIALSNERALLVISRSAHEMALTLDEYIELIEERVRTQSRTYPRWNLLGALQPLQAYNMPSAAESVRGLVRHFGVERCRVLLIDPDYQGKQLPGSANIVNDIRKVGAEVVRLDARHKTANGLLVSDFYDFT